MSDSYRIRTLAPTEVQLALDWAADEGWNPGHVDAACFVAADPEGFLVGELDGVPVATISAVRTGETFGFVGLYIVRPEHRGTGLGLRLWHAGMARLDGRAAGLDGVPAQQANYARSGFVLAHRSIRFELAADAPRPTPELAGASLVPLAARSFDEVLAADRSCFPVAREAFLDAWIHQPRAVALGLVRDGALVAHGVLRPCRIGAKIGPLVASEPADAGRVFDALVAQAPVGEPVFLDVPEPNTAALAFVAERAMSAVFDTARMYRGVVAALDLVRLWGVTTFELG